MTEPASRILEMCEAYIPIALKHLALGAPFKNESSEACFDANPEKLRIHFLFPGIAQKGFQALYDLRYYQWLYRCASKEDKQAQSIVSAHSAEQIEAKFELAQATIESAFDGLSPVQREIIQEEFFKIDRSA